MHKVLIVSYDLTALSTIKQMVQGRYDILSTDQGDTALTLMRDFKNISAIICDERPGDMSGPDFLNQADAAQPDAVLIHLVQPGMYGLRASTDAAHPKWHILPKPVDAGRLLAILDSHTGGRSTPPGEQAENTNSAAIKRALDDMDPDREFSMVYQPRICATSGKTCCVEALLRWQHPSLGTIAPARFIPLSETTGDIIWITDWTLMAACKALRSWIDGGDQPVPVSVNISPKAYNDPRLVALVANALRSANIPAHLLRLEVTAPINFAANPRACAAVETLRHMNVGVSFEGEAGKPAHIAVASKVQDDCLRTSQSLIGHLTGKNPIVLLEAIREAAAKLGVRTVAAGVENPQHLEFIRRIGFDQMQGFLIARPLSQSDLPAWLKVRASI